MKLLVIEDDAVQWRAYERIIRHAGHEAHWASSARAAIDFLRTDVYDVVVIDWELDGLMSGGEVKRHVPRGTHVAVVSGYSQAEIRALVEADPLRGVTIYVQKPIRSYTGFLHELELLGRHPK